MKKVNTTLTTFTFAEELRLFGLPPMAAAARHTWEGSQVPGQGRRDIARSAHGAIPYIFAGL